MSLPADPVLLIDDHDDSRSLLMELLELEGYRVVATRNARDTLAVMESLRPCMIFLDLGLPDLPGLELAGQLRALPAGAAVPLYALSGFAHLRAEALATVCDGFVLKPVLPSELRRIVGQHCRREPDGEKVA
ncbi:MAG TPA: response regulator [Thermoanaerobaculia bacterium]|nr:response regulator [Thermoanaerobaculia bacterium]